MMMYMQQFQTGDDRGLVENVVQFANTTFWLQAHGTESHNWPELKELRILSNSLFQAVMGNEGELSPPMRQHVSDLADRTAAVLTRLLTRPGIHADSEPWPTLRKQVVAMRRELHKG